MPRIQFKRGTKAVISAVTLQPGEPAVAVDTGDVYVGKADGSKSKLATESDIDGLVFENDDALTNPVDVNTSSIPVNLEAKRITFTDGETFQQKYEAGDFKGPKGDTGPTGAIGPKGDTGPQGQKGTDADNGYGIVIRTQEEFNRLVASPTWLDVTSVLFVGNGGTLKFTFQADGTDGIVIPATVNSISGINGAIISVTRSIDSSFVAFGYAVKPVITDDNYQLNNLTVEVLAMNGTGFRNCINLRNCRFLTSSDDSKENNISGFDNCDNLDNCQAKIYCEMGAIAFHMCSGMVSCSGDVTTFAGTPSVFNGCVDLINCEAKVTINMASGYDIGYDYFNCNHLGNCRATGNTVGQGSVIGFYNSSGLSNCDAMANGGTLGSGYGISNCKLISGCSAIGTGTSGYGIYDSSFLNGCEPGATPSSTGFLGGTNTHVDTATVG